MSKKIKRVLAWIMALALIVGFLPAQSASAAANPKLNTTKRTITIGDTVTLKIQNKIADSKYAWSSSNKKIATVTNSGAVTAVKKGSANISCKVTAGKNTYNLKCAVTVSTEAVVSTQANLKKALKNDKVTKVTIKTSSARKFSIPAGKYGKKTLVVNAPKSDVTNRGVFKSITIQAIKANTWTERAVGNKIKVTASNANIVVGKEGNVASLNLAKNDANITIKVNGEVESLVLSREAKVDLTANGKVGEVEMKAPAALTIEGKTDKIELVVSEAAKGAEVKTSVPVEAKVSANIDLKLEKGAEGSSVDKTSKDVKVKVDNQTSASVDVTTGGTDKQTVNAGKEGTVGGEDKTVTPPSSGGTDTPPPPTPTPPPTPITIYENGFETDAGGFAGNNTAVTVEVSTEQKHTGDASLKVSGGSADWHGAQLLSTGMELNAKYEISAWVYSETSRQVVMQLELGKAGGSGTDYRWLVSPTLEAGEWTEYTYTIDITSEEYESIKNLSFQNKTQPLEDAVYYVDDIKIVKIPSPIQEDAKTWMKVPSLKEAYKDYFLLGNIISSGTGLGRTDNKDTTEGYKYHFNVVTAENEMKPNYYGKTTASGIYSFTTPDKVVDWAKANDILVQGHTLAWHSQSPDWLNTGLTRAQAKENLEDFIKTVAGYYEKNAKETVFAWDVLNEAHLERSTNWKANLRTGDDRGDASKWYGAYANGANTAAGESGADYVYDAFKWARKYAPSATLYYNDFNDDNATKSTAIANMVIDINEKWKTDSDNKEPNRKLIEGVGMQSHYSTTTSVKNVEASIKRFIAAGVLVSITELDVGTDDKTEAGYIKQAQVYAQLFQVYKTYSDDIERVTFWGLKDDISWRKENNPLIFDKDFIAKEAYYAVLDPDDYLKKHPTDVVVAKPKTSIALKGTPSMESGVIDPEWDTTVSLNADRFVEGTKAFSNFATGEFKVLWDEENLYVLGVVTDEKVAATATAEYLQDCVEVFFSPSNNKTGAKGEYDGQYRVNCDNKTSGDIGKCAGFESVTWKTDTGYVVKIRFPFSGLDFTPEVNKEIGFDCQVNDEGREINGTRNSVAVWCDTSNGGAYNDTGAWGTLTLVDDVNERVLIKDTAVGKATNGKPSGENVEDRLNSDDWANVEELPVFKWTTNNTASIFGTTKETRATGTARVKWDETYLYVRVEVKDKNINYAHSDDWEKDCVEVYVEDTGSAGGQSRLTYNGIEGGPVANGGNTFIKDTADGYIAYLEIPHGLTGPEISDSIKFDVQINDATSTENKRTDITTWSDWTANGYGSSEYFGKLILVAEGQGENPIVPEPNLPTPIVPYFGETILYDIFADGNVTSATDGSAYVTPALIEQKAPSVTVKDYNGGKSLLISGRTADYHGLDIKSAQMKVDDKFVAEGKYMISVTGHIDENVEIPEKSKIKIAESESPWSTLKEQAVSNNNRKFSLQCEVSLTANQIVKLGYDFRIQSENAGNLPFYIDSFVVSVQEPVELSFTFDSEDKENYESWWKPGSSMDLTWVDDVGNGDNYSLKVTAKEGNTDYNASNRGIQVVFPNKLPSGQYYISADFYAPLEGNPDKTLDEESILLNSTGGSSNHRFPANASEDGQGGTLGEWVTIGGETAEAFNDAINDIRFRYFGNKKDYNPEVFYLDNVTVKLIGAVEIEEWPDPEWDSKLDSIKDKYSEYFLLGNIMEPENLEDEYNTAEMFKKHYNVMTAENVMKPDQISKAKGSYNFIDADKLVEWALENEIDVHGHTLVWHSQSPEWLNKGSAANRKDAKENMEEFITEVATQYKGKVISWDVVNEAFENDANGFDGKDWRTGLRKDSPWYIAYKNGAGVGEDAADYIYDAFVLTRLIDPNAELYYNDYNEEIPNKRDAIALMVEDLNAKWEKDERNTEPGRLLIEGIGMQSHYWAGGFDASLVEAAIARFAETGARISISELDMPMGKWNEQHNGKKLTKEQEIEQAVNYAKLFSLYIKYADAIDRVTIWGKADIQSWRKTGMPVLFDNSFYTKEAYYAVMDPEGYLLEHTSGDNAGGSDSDGSTE